MSVILFDLETDGLLDEVSKVHCLCITYPHTEGDDVLSYHDDKELPRDGTLAEGLDKLREAGVLCGHNIAGYDLPVLRKLFDFDWHGEVHDTVVWSRLVYSDRRERDFALVDRNILPGRLVGAHSLESWGHRLGDNKGDYDGGWETFSQEMLTYCIQDVRLNAKLYHVLRSRLPKFAAGGFTTAQVETEFADMLETMGRVGVPFDAEACDDLLGKLRPRQLELEDQLRSAFPPKKEYYKINKRTGKRTQRRNEEGEMVDYKLIPFQPGSRIQLANALMDKYGWVPTNYTAKGDPQMVEEVMLDLADVYPEAKLAAELYIVKARIGTLETGNYSYIKCAKDGRIHNRTLHIGTITHRSSHSRPNLGNPTSVRKPWGKEIRAMFVPVDSEKFEYAGWDQSGLEHRMLGNALATYDRGNYAHIVDQGDIHMLYLEAVERMGVKATRDQVKASGYAWLYGCGVDKLGAMNGGNRVLGSKIKKAFSKGIVGMDSLLKFLGHQARQYEGVLGLDGRRAGVRSSHSLLNTKLQMDGSICMRWMPVYLKQELAEHGIEWGVDYIPHLHVHDEMQGSLRKGLREPFTAAVQAANARTVAALNLRVPLRCDVVFGDNWLATH